MILFVFGFMCNNIAQTSENPFDNGIVPTTPTIPASNNQVAENQEEISDNKNQQYTNNPFDALKGGNQSDPIQNIQDTTSTSTTNSNPFDLSLTSKSTTVTSKTIADTPPIIDQPKDSSIRAHHNKPLDNTKGFLMILTIIMMVLFAVAVTLFRSFLAKAYQAFASDSALRSAYREMGSAISFPYIILYTLFLFNAGIFIYLLSQHFGINIGSKWKGVFLFTAGISLIFLFKHTLIQLVGWIFPVSKEIGLYNFAIIVFNIVLGALLIPINLLVAYAPMTLWAIYGASITILLIYFYRSFRGILLAERYVVMHKFHFFMYLCVVEVAPLLLLIKFILIKIGIQ